MDLNFSQDSFAFSDITGPSHVSGLESFSDFDASECSEASFAEIVPNKGVDTDLGTSVSEENAGQTNGSLENGKESSATEKSSLGLQELNSNNINEFFEAIHNAESLGFAALSESGKSLAGDESSLGILQLDGLPDFSDDFQTAPDSSETPLTLERTLVGNEEDSNDLDEVVLDHHTDVGNQPGEDIPFTNGSHPPSDQTPVVNRNTVLQLEEERPDTGQDPDTFFSSNNVQANDNFQESVDDEPLQHSYGQEELDMMLQRRAGSGDGGELIDRVSLTSSISFIQSQTFPDSIFSQSFGSRGLGSGMDSRSESDGQEDCDEVTSPPLHGAGDGSNDITGRPGLEGANSDVEDLQIQNGPSLDANNRQETQAIELRQSAEGVDVLPDILGDGGGGGDGSSGNSSDTDDGGPAGAAYASSSASSLPSSTFPPSITSFGFINQSTGGNFLGTSSLPVSDGLTAGRGCPVGDAAAERSPVLPSSPPEWINELQDSVTIPHSLQFQSSSTPMVREGVPQNCNNTGTHNETSALESYYLMGHNVATPRSIWAEDGSFHMSQQMLGNRQSNSPVDAESLNFDPTAIEAAHNVSQDKDKTLISSETAFGGHSNQESDQRFGSWPGDRSAVSASINQSSPDFSIKFGNSIFSNGDSAIDSSKLWKSTPRDEEENGMRSTPGVVFQGNQRPSTVTGQVAVNNQLKQARTEHSSGGDHSTTLASGVTTWREGNSQGLVDLSGDQNDVDPPTDRTLTPGGVAYDPSIQQAAAPWEINAMASCPWPDGSGEMQDSMLRSNPFEVGSIDQHPWSFGGGGGGALSEEDQPLGSGSKHFSWTGSDFGFEVQGDAEAIIAAGEESFNKEHELEIPSHSEISDTTKLHDWTVPESKFVTRPSLLKVVGINDPNNLGEVRISFGAFLAAGSGELGSLTRTSPDRPRPHFGDDKPILTPSPQPPVRMISKPTTPFDEFIQESTVTDNLSNRTSADGGIKEPLQQQPKHVAKEPQKHNQLKKEESLEAASGLGTSMSWLSADAHSEELSLEMQKLKLDEQFKVDSTFKSRSRTASQTSSQSSSSKGSIKSVIKIDSFQSAQPSKNIAGDSRSISKEGKRSHRKAKQASQVVSTNSLDLSSGSELGLQQELQELYKHSSRIGSPRRSSVGDASSAASLEKMTQFIAKAINEDPDEIRKKLTAVEKKKSKAKLRRKHISSSEVESISLNSRTSDFKPVSSSSPQTKSSPEKLVDSSVKAHGIEPHNNSNSPDKLVSYSIEDSVFRSHDSPSMIPLSMKELDSKDLSLEHESMSSSEMGNFQHVIPQFGETYTLRKDSKENNQHFTAPTVDPRKHRTHEIEQRLNCSLPKDADHDNFSHPPMATRQLHPLIQESTLWQSESSPPRQRLETSDSAVGSMTTSLSEDVATTRHSWPEATPRRWYKTKEDSHWAAKVQSGATQPGSTTAAVGLATHIIPTDDVKVAVQTSSLNEGLPSSLLIHGHQPAGLANHNSSPLGIPFSTSQGIVPLVNQGTISHLYPGSGVTGSIGLSGLAGPLYPGNGLSIQTHGPLSHTAPVGYGPRMVPVGSAMYPSQGHGLLNTLHGQVPLVHTVSASMGPKPSSLTPTYVQSVNVNIPHKEPTHQLPLQFQSNPSNISGLPNTFTQPKIPASLPFYQPSFQHDPNGLLQVRPEFSQGRVLQSPSQLIIPGEIKVPPFCCVGVLTETVIPLHNSSSRWMHCEIHSVLSTVNGVQVPSTSSAFSCQLKAIIGPHTTENIKLSIEPKEAGTLTTQLQVYSLPVVSEVPQVTHSVGPVLALEVVAEEPQVEVVLEDENSIFFGEVSFGAKQCRPIHLVNRGRAQVPIRIIISANSSSLNCFTFADADFTPKTDVVRGPASAGAKGSALTIHTLFIKGRKDLTSKVEPTVVWLLFQSPNMGVKSSTSVGPPNEYTARLDVEIDSALQGLTISSVALKAIEGIVRLHTPHKVQVLTLKSPVGKSTSCTIPVKNAGNITAKVNLRIEGDSKQFSVKPAQLRIKPEEESEVQVVFQPTEGDKQVESLVILAVPNGPVYELVLRGSALPKEDDMFALLSSKPVLCWSGVALGWSQQQKVILKTSSATPVKLQLMIEGNHSDYQIQPMFSSHGGSPEHPQATLEPKKELPVHVSFSPSSMGLISSSLVIRSLAGKTKSKIPLYGCGGTSQLVLVDIRQLSEGYVTNIGEVSLGKKNSVKVVVRNSGTRAAFVKAMCYSDIHTLQRYPSSHLKIHPDSFVLSERTSKAVLIEYQPLEKDAINCRTSVNSVAVVAFYTGNEFLRRQYKKNLYTRPLQHSSQTIERSLLSGIDFTTAFQDEEKLVEDVKYPKVASWDSFFQGSVSRVLLTLVGSPPGSSPNNKPDPNRSVDIVPVSDKQAVKSQETSPVNGNLAAECWTVIPDFLTLSPSNSEDDKSGKGSDQLRILNFSDRSIGFEFTWPAHSIIITPERGKIPPRSQARVLVSSKSNLSSSSTPLPWGGTIYLKCDGKQQTIRVQIREERILESSPHQSGTSNFQSIPTMVTGNTPLPTNHLPPLRIKNKDIVFERTMIGTVTTSEISLTNTASENLTWNLSSVAPAYVKVDDTGNICRTTYLAFSMAKQEGTIQAGRTAKIVVKFQPRDAGEYEQSWDLMTTSDANKSKQKIFLHGQAVDRIGDVEGQGEDVDTFLPAKSKKVTIKEPLRSPKSVKKGLYVKENVLQFPVTVAGATSEAQLKICNGSGDDQYAVRVSSLKTPFSVQNSKFSVRANRFVRLPVRFSPTEPGKSYEASFVITADPDVIIKVQLQGSSSV
ncbi:uncharacterized protein LOC111335223 isoform X4 [Stylophora pistillata]|uniref:uncharacterized protein LOC111335223 isoform X4 n=1 Tax=Stylophora pistillata TaxID=50429 RepID=UPI000C04C766|nr:uncharacterized protein LOC111335223 isoform X4 [Stylophora pistillata]